MKAKEKKEAIEVIGMTEIEGRILVVIGTECHSIPKKGFFIKTITEWEDEKAV